MRKRIIFGIGIGILILLLALAGTGSAKSNGQFGFSCNNCHAAITPEAAVFYNQTHRYNETVINPPNCDNCHVSVSATPFNMNLSLKTGTPTYLKSTTCQNCHKQKYDEWKGTNHANKLQTNTSAEAMNLPLPEGHSWSNFSYVVIGLSKMYYFNETGYRVKGYNATSMSFENIASPGKYTCGGCHTTGYNASGINALPGVVGTWNEAGIACERCHGAGGNGHQVEANVSAGVCTQCHTQANLKTFASSGHAPPLKASASCTQCHSPFDYAKNKTVTSTSAANVVCNTCHNPHDVTPEGYRSLYSAGGFNATKMAELAAEDKAKLSFFNSTASRAAGQYVYEEITTPRLISSGVDSSYGGPINVTGPVSEVLCSLCHYNHGLSYIGGVNLTHARVNYPKYGLQPATCVDCHMSGSQGNHSFNVKDETNFPSLTCSRGTECHVTSSQNLNKSAYSVVPVVNEWKASAHNNSEWGEGYNSSSCAQCHSPMNWNPLNSSARIAPEDYKGVTCAVCHNFHDMGDWLTKTNATFGKAKPYAWYDRDGIPIKNATGYITRYRANYSMMATTTELCTNCHQNRPQYSAPSWSGRGPHKANVPHASSQKDLFVGSWKESGILKFECTDCHMASKIIDPTNLIEKVLPDSQKVTGHTFKVNATILQSNTACSGCHATGTELGNVSKTIEDIKTDIQTKWNAANATVESTWETYNAYAGEKNLSSKKLAEAFFKLYQVKNDGSMGVHNPQKANELLSDAVRLANEAITTLGQKEIVSRVQLKAGWNLAALNGTPAVTSAASVMDSVKNNITVVWGYNTTKASLGQMPWELYDPAMPAVLNSLKNLEPGKGYWIYAKADVEWTS